MFGTLGRAKVKPENREKVLELLRQDSDEAVPGYRTTWIMFPENRQDEVLFAVFFADAPSYWRNADDPKQDAWYQELRALLEGDPEWSDGDWIEGPSGSA